MAAPRALLLLSLLLAAPQGRGQRPPPPHNPLEKVVTEGNLSLGEVRPGVPRGQGALWEQHRGCGVAPRAPFSGPAP